MVETAIFRRATRVMPDPDPRRPYQFLKIGLRKVLICPRCGGQDTASTVHWLSDGRRGCWDCCKADIEAKALRRCSECKKALPLDYFPIKTKNQAIIEHWPTLGVCLWCDAFITARHNQIRCRHCWKARPHTEFVVPEDDRVWVPNCRKCMRKRRLLTPQSSKRCFNCKGDKDASQFYYDRRSPDGLSSYCRVCMKVKSKEYRERKRARYPRWFKQEYHTDYYHDAVLGGMMGIQERAMRGESCAPPPDAPKTPPEMLKSVPEAASPKRLSRALQTVLWGSRKPRKELYVQKRIQDENCSKPLETGDAAVRTE